MHRRQGSSFALTPLRSGILVATLLSIFALAGILEARIHTPTVDEFAYVPMGLHYWRTGRFEIDRRGPPLMKMLLTLPLLATDVQLPEEPQWRGDGEGWWPWIYGTRFMQLNAPRYLDLFWLSRLMNVVVGLSGGIVLWLWARRLFSAWVALMCLLFYCTCPTVLAHSAVATLDLGVTALSLAGFLLLWMWSEQRRAWLAALAGVALGLAVAAKFSAVFTFPLIPMLCGIRWNWREGIRSKFFLGMLLIGFFGWLAIEAAYLFQGFPLPKAMMEGMLLKTGDTAAGEPSFLLDRWSPTGWRSYYLVAMGLKFTVPLLAMLLIAAVCVVRDRQNWRDNAWLVLPPLLVLYVLSFQYTINYGIRYLLPAMPLLILLTGRGATQLVQHRAGRYLLALLLVWQVATWARATPHHLSYFNEMAGGPEHNRHQLLDSNLDWGQDLGQLKTYLDSQGLGKIGLAYFGHVDPALYGIDYTLPPTQPEPGVYAISANYLAGYAYAITYAGIEPISVRPGAWQWLNAFRPKAVVGRSIFVYQIEPGEINPTR